MDRFHIVFLTYLVRIRLPVSCFCQRSGVERYCCVDRLLTMNLLYDFSKNASFASRRGDRDLYVEQRSKLQMAGIMHVVWLD